MPLTFSSRNASCRASRVKRQVLQSVESLEGRTLMTATLMRDINLTAQQPENVTDINGTAFYTYGNSEISLYTDASSSPVRTFSTTSTLANFTPVGSLLFFTVKDSAAGRTLWRSDGTSAGTFAVKDITPGRLEWDYVELLGVGSTLYFGAADGSGGLKLWKSDGTVAGTVLVKDVYPQAFLALPYELTAAGSTVYFTRTGGGGTGNGFWKSDGTAEGTEGVRSADPRAGLSGPDALTPIGSTLYFINHSDTYGYRLWRTDGTVAGTEPVNTMPGIPLPQMITAAGNNLYAVFASAGSFGLQKTDGTDSGTETLLQITNYPYFPKLSHFTAVDSGLYFVYDDGVSGKELWHSDGTAAGTGMVADLNPGPEGSDPRNLTAVGSALYFTATDASNVTHLYKTDGRSGGTNALAVLHDLDLRYKVPASGDSLIHAVLDGAFYYVDNDPTYGPELFRTDGMVTGIVKDLVPGPEGIHPRDLTVVGDHVDFAGNDGSNMTGLFQTDGTAAGTRAVNLFTDVATADSTSGSKELGTLGNVAIFLADDGIHGAELWRSDGTTTGTSLVANINPNGGIQPTAAILLNGYLYFGLDDAGAHGLSGLWRTDGTAAGTALVRAFDGQSPEELTLLGDQIYFSADDGSTGVELWKSDGTSAGTALVKDVKAGPASSYPSGLATAGSNLFFTTRAEPVGKAFPKVLWKTDGTTGETVEVRSFDSANLPSDNHDYPKDFSAAGDTLYFFGPNENTVPGYSLWKSDGTTEGTVVVKQLERAPGLPSIAIPLRMMAVGSSIFFTMNEDSQHAELWTSDGTAAGTILLKQIGANRPANLSRDPFFIRNLTALDAHTLLFTAVDDAHGEELWRSDGTPKGTVPVTDVNPGPADGLKLYAAGVKQLQIIDGFVYFVADNGTDGIGLYRTDGTALGTVRFQNDVSYRDTDSAVLAVLPSGILVAADDSYGTGLEPYLLDGTLANMSPVFNPLADQTAWINRPLTIPVTAGDPNVGQTLNYDVRDETANPDFTATIDAVTGTVTFQAQHAGTYQFHVDVSDNGSPLPLTTTTTVTVVVRNAVANDFDGDGTSDYVVYRPSQALWIVRQSSGGTTLTSMGDPSAGDIAAPGDFDGDGVTDFAVYRPSSSLWIVRQSSGGTFMSAMGDPSQGDVAAPGDYDGDGKTDLAVYRPSQALWIVRQSSGGTTLTSMGDPSAGDIAAPGDFDGDGITDFAVYRPSSSLWIVRQSSGGTFMSAMGDPSQGDIAAPGDYDGDGKTDLAVYRPSQALWIVRQSSGGTTLTSVGDPSAGDIAANASPYFQIRRSSSPRSSFDLSASVTVTPPAFVPQPSEPTTATRPNQKASGRWY